jgi:hypothetical protein
VPKEKNMLATAERKKLSGRTLLGKEIVETTDPFHLNGNKRDKPSLVRQMESMAAS